MNQNKKKKKPKAFQYNYSHYNKNLINYNRLINERGRKETNI